MSKSRRASSKLGKRWPWLLVFVLILAIAGSGYWWFFKRGRVSTDDAYVKADSATVSSRVQGSVSKIFVDNDLEVEAGQVLLTLDPRDYQVAVAREEAVVASMDAEIEAARLTAGLTDSQTQTQIQGAEAAFEEARNQEQSKFHQLDELQKRRPATEAEFVNARRQFERYDSLYRQGASSEQTRDDALTAFDKASANLKAVDAEIASVKSSLAALQHQIQQSGAKLTLTHSDRSKVKIQFLRLESLEAQKKEASAKLEQARLNLEYCNIKAPIAGRIAQKSVQLGNRIQPGQPLMAVVPLQAVYVEANFKESQLGGIRVGQKAEVQADVYPGHTFEGTVTGIRAGTGAAFALLPPENATGNWVKIVQRVPVKIEFDRPVPPEYALRMGMSLTVTVFTGGGARKGPEPARQAATPQN